MRILTIDAGTTRTKAAVYDDGLSRLSFASRPTRAVGGGGGVNPELLFEDVTAAVREVVNRAHIDAVAVTAILGWVFLGRDGRLLGPGRAWSDRRAAAEAEELDRAFESAGVDPGRPVTPELLAPQLLYLQRREPEFYRKIHRVAGLKDYLVHELTGIWSTDYSHDDYSLRDLGGAFQPARELLQEDLLPEAVAAWQIVGEISGDGSRLTGLERGIPVVAGSSDGTAAMYGAGILSGSVLSMVTGTTDVVMRAVRLTGDRRSDEGRMPRAEGLSVNRAIVSGTYLVGGSTGGSGSSLAWWRTIAPAGGLSGNAPTGQSSPAWESVDPGAGGLMVAPGFSGERAPFPGVSAGGAITGLTAAHTAAHIERAIVEANAFRLAVLAEMVAGAAADGDSADTSDVVSNVGPAGTPPFEILLGGGSSRVTVNGIRAAVLPYPVRLLSDPELSLVGCAMFGIAALAGKGGTTGSAAPVSRAEARLRELAGLVRSQAQPLSVNPGMKDRYRPVYACWRAWIRWYYRY